MMKNRQFEILSVDLMEKGIFFQINPRNLEQFSEIFGLNEENIIVKLVSYMKGSNVKFKLVDIDITLEYSKHIDKDKRFYLDGEMSIFDEVYEFQTLGSKKVSEFSPREIISLVLESYIESLLQKKVA